MHILNSGSGRAFHVRSCLSQWPCVRTVRHRKKMGDTAGMAVKEAEYGLKMRMFLKIPIFKD